jgi:hypothetical protein
VGKENNQGFILANDWFDLSQQSTSLSWKNHERFTRKTPMEHEPKDSRLINQKSHKKCSVFA